MKKLLVLFFLILAHAISASATPKYIFKTGLAISCVSNAKSWSIQKFELEFTVNGPQIPGLDASLIDTNDTDGMYGMTFSNECDNYYSLRFNRQELAAMSQKQLDVIKGSLVYSDPELIENEENQNEESLEVTCYRYPALFQTKSDLLSNALKLRGYLQTSSKLQKIECQSKDGKKLTVKEGYNPEDGTRLVIEGDFQYGTNAIKQIHVGSTTLIEFGEESNYQFVFELTENPKQFGQTGAAYVVSEGNSLDTLSCKLK